MCQMGKCVQRDNIPNGPFCCFYVVFYCDSIFRQYCLWNLGISQSINSISHTVFINIQQKYLLNLVLDQQQKYAKFYAIKY